MGGPTTGFLVYTTGQNGISLLLIPPPGRGCERIGRIDGSPVGRLSPLIADDREAVDKVV
jgi:hypothetical protein